MLGVQLEFLNIGPTFRKKPLLPLQSQRDLILCEPWGPAISTGILRLFKSSFADVENDTGNAATDPSGREVRQLGELKNRPNRNETKMDKSISVKDILNQ